MLRRLMFGVEFKLGGREDYRNQTVELLDRRAAPR